MKTYTIRTGGQRWRQQGKSMEAAAVAAFKVRPPKRPGTLTEMTGPERVPHYMKTIPLLKRAGFSVPPESETSANE